MVTPLQLAHVYATIGGFGIERPLSITRIDPPVMGTRVMPEQIVHEVEHMMESVALPGGGGTKAAVRDYRVAVKTGTAKKIGPTANISINMWPIPQAWRPPVVRSLRWWW
jgi:cell division protein FtsI (penicillin-binding protein 3)